MIDSSAPREGALSPNFLEHLQDFCPVHRATLDQADHHPHIAEQPWMGRPEIALRHPKTSRCRWWWWWRWSRRRRLPVSFLPVPLPVELLFALFALGPTIIGSSSDRGLSPTVSFLAAKGTTQVFPTAITRMSQKKDPAVPASDQASSQERLGSQNRSQQHVILQHQSSHFPTSIPLRQKLEVLRDLSCQKPKIWLWMLTCLKTPSSCQSDTPVSRQDEDFFCRKTTHSQPS